MLILLFLIFSTDPLKAEYLTVGRDLIVNLPASWQVDGTIGTKLSASNRADEAFLLIQTSDGSRFDSVETMFASYIRELEADAQGGDTFLFSGNSAYIGTLRFSFDGEVHSGYILCIESLRLDAIALAFASGDDFPAYQDMLLSIIDSIALGENGLMSPGPVSQSLSPYPEPDRDLFQIQFDGKEIPVSISREALAASQEVIEREARVLVAYAGTPYAEEAWQRYYRMLYRDLYRRSRPVYTALRQHLRPEDSFPREISEKLLQWVQGFEYSRMDTVSDCLTPLQGAVEQTGDCDSRGLLLTMLLHSYGIEAILMVSGLYGHSMVGVDIPGDGARFAYNGKNYLVAETTDQVDLGLIDSSMADPNGWLGVDFFNARILSASPADE